MECYITESIYKGSFLPTTFLPLSHTLQVMFNQTRACIVTLDGAIRGLLPRILEAVNRAVAVTEKP